MTTYPENSSEPMKTAINRRFYKVAVKDNGHRQIDCMQNQLEKNKSNKKTTRYLKINFNE